MGGGMVPGAALGAAFDLLFISVIDATQRVACFSSDLNRLKATLCSIRVSIDDVERFNKMLDRPRHETEALTLRLIEGEKLIRKCSKVRWNVFMRLYYANKLNKLEALLVKLFQMDMAAVHFRETKRISVVMSSLEGKVDEFITTLLKRSQIGSTSSSEIVVEIQHENEGIMLPSDGRIG